MCGAPVDPTTFFFSYMPVKFMWSCVSDCMGCSWNANYTPEFLELLCELRVLCVGSFGVAL